MEMRAREETSMGRDLTPPVPPLAAALHDSFLGSHCSSCFRPFSHPTTLFSCPACDAAVLYCSTRCSSSDSALHSSSAECLLFRLLAAQSPPSLLDSADLRAALRLLFSLETLGFLSDFDPDKPQTRIGGLLASGLEVVLSDGGEAAERIEEGAALMARARNKRDGGVLLEELVLLAVLINGVEVLIGDEGTLGIAVYGPHFSWFNHSCSPNACYRFEVASPWETPAGSCGPISLSVSPHGSDGEGTDVWNAWSCGDAKLPRGFCTYGPSVVVRSIKPIKKDEEVCIAYTDLLQPMAERHFGLWSKYRFACCCDRCGATPQMYIDYILSYNFSSCELRILDSDNIYKDAEFAEVAVLVDQVIEDYMTDGNPEVCCTKLEKLLSKSFHSDQFQAEQPLQIKFNLQPLHHVSFNAYLTLASAYKIRSANIEDVGLDEFNILYKLEMSRAAAAYSLLLAGATNHLFLFDSSLISSTTLYWISAGESLLDLVRSSIWGSTKELRELKLSLVLDCSECPSRNGSSASWVEFKATCVKFLECASSILLKSWPFLVQKLPYLEDIKSPVDFSWLEFPIGSTQTASSWKNATKYVGCTGYQDRAETSAEEERSSLFLLAIQCLTYGRYLANICYGSDSYLADHARNLLYGSR